MAKYSSTVDVVEYLHLKSGRNDELELSVVEGRVDSMRGRMHSIP